MCQKCKVYLYDFFQQPLDKANPLHSFVNQKQLQRRLPELIDIVYHILFTFPLLQTRFLNAKSNAENYCTFVGKAETTYQYYDIIYTFLKMESAFLKEINAIEGYLFDLQFLKIPRTAKNLYIVEKWLAFLIGVLFEDMQQLHIQHNSKGLSCAINLD